MKAADAMVRPLVTVGPRDFARHAGGLMDDFGLTMLPVADQGVFLGVVTRTDVARGKEGVQAPLVQQVMSQPVLVATRDTPAATLFDAMTRYEVLCVPVLDDGHIAGVVTRLSVLRLISRNTAQPHVEADRAAVHG
ncbi:CBS domain-containing protein [Lentzea xinjiangensis]|uniref:CBS domain-containing protein n=1 Tax=Lentzea xinjiangensis TaxID=402600 RepID=A0A1H9KPU1_9PSEU|nr:CBS domain-containing protein [Lentzea xinjiangensis]SER00945.1 CBS domain-containing protein [Lentzea xinjiangensis]